MIISIGKKSSKKPIKKQVKLEQHIIENKPQYLSYINNDTEYIYSGEINKTSNGYIGKIFEKITYNIEMEVTNTYSYTDSHYSYVDKDGYVRTFNKLDTLKYNEESNSYFGIITEVNYEDNKISIFEE